MMVRVGRTRARGVRAGACARDTSSVRAARTALRGSVGFASSSSRRPPKPRPRVRAASRQASVRVSIAAASRVPSVAGRTLHSPGPSSRFTGVSHGGSARTRTACRRGSAGSGAAPPPSPPAGPGE